MRNVTPSCGWDISNYYAIKIDYLHVRILQEDLQIRPFTKAHALHCVIRVRGCVLFERL